MIRRQFLLGAAAWGATATSLVACSSAESHQQAALALRRGVAVDTSDRAQLLRELVRNATLAPSSHNTQCWRFHLGENAIGIEPDFLRRCPVVDPDDHHIFVSLGCATENLAQAALANGLQADAAIDASGAILVKLEATKAVASPLFQAISERQCTRGDYDGKALSVDELRQLEEAGSGNGVRVIMLTQRADMEKVLEYVVAGNTAQLGDPAFVAELKSWIRFSDAEAIETGDGLFSGASGQPAMPRWLGSPLMGLFMTAKSDADRYSRQVRNSAGIAVFVSDTSDKAHWMQAGRCYERFALQATALGIRNAFLNQPVEVGSVRPGFAASLGLGNLRPDLVVRFGRGQAMPLSMRRPVQSVMS